MTSCQNCWIMPEITGPRQMTGASSFSSSRLTLITRMPVFVSIGKMPSALPSARPCSPNILGIDGPVTSASRIAVLEALRLGCNGKHCGHGAFADAALAADHADNVLYREHAI